MALLEVRDIVVRFGGVTAVAGVSFDVGEREICGLIGPNGAGKTTLFNVISGIYRPNEGSVRFAGRDTTGLPRHRMAPLGLGRTFQNLALFRSMTVRENILAGAHSAGAGSASATSSRVEMLGLRPQAPGARSARLAAPRRW
jgi:branched-chain amino acid transport system ATP-binding protein